MGAGDLLEHLTLIFSVFWIIYPGQGWERGTKCNPDLLAEAQDNNCLSFMDKILVWGLEHLPPIPNFLCDVACPQAPAVTRELTLVGLLCVSWADGQW